MAFTENKRGNVHTTQYCGVFSHNAYTSLAIITSWYHFIRRQHYYGNFMSLDMIKHT